MKGLLYKDVLSVYRSYRSFFVIVAVFLIVSLFNDNASYWASYAGVDEAQVAPLGAEKEEPVGFEEGRGRREFSADFFSVTVDEVGILPLNRVTEGDPKVACRAVNRLAVGILCIATEVKRVFFASHRNRRSLGEAVGTEGRIAVAVGLPVIDADIREVVPFVLRVPAAVDAAATVGQIDVPADGNAEITAEAEKPRRFGQIGCQAQINGA